MSGGSSGYFAAKRMFDIIASGVGLIITSPIWLMAAIGIEISDRGPVFYKADRIGKGSRPFFMYKFRSMRVDNKADEKSFKADVNRIFKWGEFMRRTKIDELPQLLNVFKGDMSVVGPRPAAKDQVDVVRAGKYYSVSMVKPGLTSPAALYDYIYGDTIEDEAEYEEKVLPTRMELDAFYVKHMGACLDMKMLWWTIRCIFNTLLGTESEVMLDKLTSYVSAPSTERMF